MRVIIVDDDNLVTASLKTILKSDRQIEVVAIGHSGQDAIDLCASLNPDVLLMDIRMGQMTGLEAAQVIHEANETIRILFLTTFSDNEYIAKAFHIGASGYILKQNFEGIVSAINAVCLGQRVFDGEIIDKIPQLKNADRNDIAKYGLSDKELELIRQVANGLSNKEISQTLFLSEGTVRNYISLLLEKLELRDRTQLAIFYYRNL